MPSHFTVNQLSEPPSVSGGITRRGEPKGRQVTGIRARSEEPEEQDGHKKETEVEPLKGRKVPFLSPPHAPGFEDSVNYVWA